MREIPFDDNFFNIVIDIDTACYVRYTEYHQIYLEINK